MLRHARLRLLAAVHLVVLGLLGFWCKDTGGRLPGIELEYMPLVLLIALTLSQACLLGFWAALSSSWSRGWRIIGLIAGSTMLELALTACKDHFLFMPSIGASIITLILVVARRRVALRRLSPGLPDPSSEGFRWSIRGLMASTLVVGLVIAGARSTREAIGHASPNILIIAAWSFVLVVQALAACWAALGLARPGLRIPAVVLCAAVSGATFAYGLSEDGEWRSLTYFITVNAGQSVLVLGSLLVVRSAGYRLVRRGEGQPVGDDLAAKGGDVSGPAHEPGIAWIDSPVAPETS